MTDGIECVQRSKEVKVGVVILTFIYGYGLYGMVASGLLFSDSTQGFTKQHLSTFVTPMLIAGIWFGLGAARMVSVVLFTGMLAALATFPNIGFASFSMVGILLMAANTVGLALLFFPASNVWFRNRKQMFKRHGLYPLGLAIGIVIGIPMVFYLLMMQTGPLVGGRVIFVAILYVFYIPAIIFGRPHFMFGIGAGPADDTGWILMIAFYALVATVLIAALWFIFSRKKTIVPDIDLKASIRNSLWIGAIMAVVACVSLMLMLIPLGRGSSALKAELNAKMIAAQATRDAVLADYPELDGPFTVLDEDGQYGIKSSGRWKISKGKLEIVADSTEIWNRFPRCNTCAGLKSWQFTLHSARNFRGPWLGLAEQRTGFSPMTDMRGLGPDGKITIAGHRMVVPIADHETVSAFAEDKREDGKVLKHLPPGLLANYWIGIELTFTSEQSYPVSVTNPFMFADLLAAKGLETARCAAPQSIADAVERACHNELAQMLQDPARRADIEKGDENLRAFSKESTPLQMAVWKKDVQLVNILLNNGANPNKIGYSGYTLLMTAVDTDADDIVLALVRNKAKLDEQNTKTQGQDAGTTALILAAERGRTDAIMVLLAAGADKSIRDRKGYTAYQHAEHFRHSQAAALLK